MTWSEEVHASRLASSLSAARATRPYRQQKKRVPLAPTANPLQVIAMVGAAAGFMVFKRHSAELHKVQWSQLPLIKQFHDLVFGSSGTKLSAGPKAKTKKQKKPKTPAANELAPATAAAMKEALKPSTTVRAKGKPDTAAPKPAAKSDAAAADAPAKAGGVRPTPAPLQQSHVAPFQQPAGKPASVGTGTARPKPAAKPATVGSSMGLQRHPSGGGTAPSLMSGGGAAPALSPTGSATAPLISDARG